MAGTVLLAITAAKKSGALKELRNLGEKILGQLSGCKIKPKGTPHQDVWNKAPKFFFTYGTNTPGAGNFRPSSVTNGAYFDLTSGQWITNLEGVFSVSERKAVEATLRKPCESVTGDASFYVEVRPPADDRGWCKLSDGLFYAAGVYNVQGGPNNAPTILSNVEPKGKVADETGAEPNGTQIKQAGFGPLGLLLGAGLVLSGLGKK